MGRIKGELTESSAMRTTKFTHTMTAVGDNVVAHFIKSGFVDEKGQRKWFVFEEDGRNDGEPVANGIVLMTLAELGEKYNIGMII